MIFNPYDIGSSIITRQATGMIFYQFEILDKFIHWIQVHSSADGSISFGIDDAYLDTSYVSYFIGQKIHFIPIFQNVRRMFVEVQAIGNVDRNMMVKTSDLQKKEIFQNEYFFDVLSNNLYFEIEKEEVFIADLNFTTYLSSVPGQPLVYVDLQIDNGQIINYAFIDGIQRIQLNSYCRKFYARVYTANNWFLSCYLRSLKK